MGQLIDGVDSTAEASELQERELVARLRAGDETTFAQLVDEWSPVMLHVARRYVANTHAAEDVVQEAWLGVIKGLPRFEGRSSLRSWTFSISTCSGAKASAHRSPRRRQIVIRQNRCVMAPV